MVLAFAACSPPPEVAPAKPRPPSARPLLAPDTVAPQVEPEPPVAEPPPAKRVRRKNKRARKRIVKQQRVRVATVEGVVMRGKQRLKAGDLIAAGSSIEVQEGRVELALGEQGSVKLFRKSRVQIKRSNLFHLTIGRLWAKIRSLGQGFEVSTPNAVAGVRGTEFVVEVLPNRSMVGVVHGTVEVASTKTPQQGRPVKGNQQARLDGTDTTVKLAPFKAQATLASWEASQQTQVNPFKQEEERLKREMEDLERQTVEVEAQQEDIEKQIDRKLEGRQ